jgi:hypothetical protein
MRLFDQESAAAPAINKTVPVRHSNHSITLVPDFGVASADLYCA